MNILNRPAKVLIKELELKKRVEELVIEISKDRGCEDMVLVGVLKGSFMFVADLVRMLYIEDIHPLIDFVIISSYGDGTKSSGQLRFERNITTDVKGKCVLLVDDILDTGRTLAFLKQHIMQMDPAVLRTCVLLDKPSRRLVPIEADYVGFKIEDKFVVGYGLDYASRFRELPYISYIEA